MFGKLIVPQSVRWLRTLLAEFLNVGLCVAQTSNIQHSKVSSPHSLLDSSVLRCVPVVGSSYWVPFAVEGTAPQLTGTFDDLSFWNRNR